MRRTSPKSDWSREILSLRRFLKLTQGEFARRLNTSAMTVSRWERGQAEPSAEAYIQLGNLADDPAAWFYWGRAGLTTADIFRVLPAAHRRLRQHNAPALRIVNAGVGKKLSLTPKDFVTVPILPVAATTLGENSEGVSDLDQLKPESLWAAPASWCPHPERTISFRVRGNSMSPLILDGYLIAVDTSEIRRDRLSGQIVVAWNKNTKQLVVSRFLRFDHTEALVSDQRENESVLLATESDWRITGKVLWWAGRSTQTEA